MLGQPLVLSSNTPLHVQADLSATKASASAKFTVSADSQQFNLLNAQSNPSNTTPLLATALKAGTTASSHHTIQPTPSESKQDLRPQTQHLQQLQQLQNATAAKLKYSSDRDRVRWNSTPTAEAHHGAVSKEGEVVPPTPKPFEPSFPSISEDVGLPMNGHPVNVTVHPNFNHYQHVRQHLVHGASPLASPALSTMTTGSSGWHQWNDDFDYDAVAALTGAHKQEEGTKTDTSDTAASGATASGLTREKLLEFQAAVHSGNPHTLVQSMHSLASVASLGSNIEVPSYPQQRHDPVHSTDSFPPPQQPQQQPRQPIHPPQPHPAPTQHTTRPAASRQNHHPPQTRVIVYKAGSRFGEPTGAGQLMTIPTKASKFMKPHDASALFDEFLYDAAVRLGLSKKSDPLLAPPSPSRRRRVSILGNEIKRLETDLNQGRYVDPTFLNGLKNKMEVLRLGDAATKATVLLGATEDQRDRREVARQTRTIDVTRLSLWHSKYKAQIRDFSTIRDGDALLLRFLDDTSTFASPRSPKRTTIRAELPSVNGPLVADGGSTILEDTQGGSRLLKGEEEEEEEEEGEEEGEEGGSLESVGSVGSRRSPHRSSTRSARSARRRGGADVDEIDTIENIEDSQREDTLRLRRIGLSQLLDAIKSQRTLFGKRIKGGCMFFVGGGALWVYCVLSVVSPVFVFFLCVLGDQVPSKPFWRSTEIKKE